MSDPTPQSDMDQRPAEVAPDAERELAELFRRTAPPAPPVDLAALEHRHVTRPWHQRIPMFVRLAASLAVAALIAVALLWPPGRADANWNFADVQDRMQEVKTVTYRMTFTPSDDAAEDPGKSDNKTDNKADKTDESPKSVRVRILAPSKLRVDESDGSYSVTDLRTGKSLSVSRKEKRAIRFENLATIGQDAMAMNLYQFFRDIREQAAKELPARRIDGKEYPVFLVRHRVSHGPIQDFTIEMTVWVDPKTKLPVRIEMTSDDGTADGNGRQVLDQFVFDKPLDESLFSFDVPGGYTLQSYGVAELVEPLKDDDLQKPTLRPKVGIGPVRFGMSLDEVKKLLGKPDKVAPAGERGTDVAYYSRGYGMFVSEALGVTTINAHSQLGMAVKVRDFAGQTDKGIRIGSTEEAVRQAYGEPSHVDDPQEPGSPKVLYYDDLSGWFSIWEGKVHSMFFSIPREMKLRIFKEKEAEKRGDEQDGSQ